MTETDALAQTADKYRREGYEVVERPPAADLPEALRRGYPALVARKNGKAVLVEVWSRDRVNDLPPDPLPVGWDFDVVLLPGPPSGDVPGPGPEATPEFAARLLAELEDYIPRAAHQGRFLLAWSAAESAMRVAARREGIDADRLPPRQLISQLTSAGLLSPAQSDALRELMAVRNRLVHGAPIEPVGDDAVADLVRTAKELLAAAPTRAGA